MSFISIGADVELFAMDKVGHHVALCGLIGGTKDKPKQLEHLPDGFTVQEDNVALEFNIPPSFSSKNFTRFIDKMVQETKGIINKLGLDISKNSSATFDLAQLMHPNALVFGCEPDYNAWTKRENKKPISKNKQLRTAGGHIHVGTNSNMIDVVKLMDLYLGVPSIVLDTSPGSEERRELYGKMGAMRPKPYGLEYRVLSNFWVFDKNLINWVFKQTRLACISNIDPTKYRQQIKKIINTSDKDGAMNLISELGVAMPEHKEEKKNLDFESVEF